MIKKAWEGTTNQFIFDSNENKWLVSELIREVDDQDLKSFDIPLKHLCVADKTIGDMSLRDFVSHMKQVLGVSLDYPIILDEDGAIFDGRHRVVRALIEGKESIKAFRFETDPLPTISGKEEPNE